jgi:FKBP-type peptidyl-prolyl cis-trans isomerase
MDQLRKDASYGVGMSIGHSLQEQNLDKLDLASFLEGIEATFQNKPLKFTPQEANSKIGAYVDAMNSLVYAEFKDAGEQFLSSNSKRSEVVALPSGLQYEIIEQGNGDKPSPSSEVTVHYHGTLTDGTVFDSSVSRGEPATFGVTQVIKGWTEALQLMPSGSKWRLYIPHDLAYGATPHPGGPIKPYMALIFEVELISFN